MKVTKLEKQKHSEERCNLFVDGEFITGLSIDSVLSFDLFEGKELSQDDFNKIKDGDEYQKCLTKCYDYLSRRPQSEREMWTKLRGRFDKRTIAKCIERLKELDYIDDRKFAELWIEQRQSSRGPYLLRQELKKKGIDKDVIAEVIEQKCQADEAEIENATRLARKKLKSGMTKEEIFSKVAGLLSRKGYSYDLVKKVIDKINEV